MLNSDLPVCYWWLYIQKITNQTIHKFILGKYSSSLCGTAKLTYFHFIRKPLRMGKIRWWNFCNPSWSVNTKPSKLRDNSSLLYLPLIMCYILDGKPKYTMSTHKQFHYNQGQNRACKNPMKTKKYCLVAWHIKEIAFSQQEI